MRMKDVVLQGYDSLLSIDDIEKKALAQPPESRSVVCLGVLEMVLSMLLDFEHCFNSVITLIS